MRIEITSTLAALMIAACVAWIAQAEITARVNTDRVNARGRASIFSEVVAQLRQGDRVTVLEVIRPANPRPGEPSEWVKIRLPANALVWVNAAHVDVVKNVVTANRLNVRAGPGQNYSIVGSLNQGDPIRKVRSLDDWFEIEAPPNSWAFVNGLFVTIKRTSSENSADLRRSDAGQAGLRSAEIDPARPTRAQPGGTNSLPVDGGTSKEGTPSGGQNDDRGSGPARKEPQS